MSIASLLLYSPSQLKFGPRPLVLSPSTVHSSPDRERISTLFALMAQSARCWECRRRRIHCDSSLPACTQCSSKGRLCPGYSDQKPLRWRHHVPASSASSTASPESPESIGDPQLRHDSPSGQSPSDSVTFAAANDIMNYCWLPT